MHKNNGNFKKNYLADFILNALTCGALQTVERIHAMVTIHLARFVDAIP